MAGTARLIANPARASSKGIFIVFSRGRRMICRFKICCGICSRLVVVCDAIYLAYVCNVLKYDSILCTLCSVCVSIVLLVFLTFGGNDGHFIYQPFPL
jgi:hypothetical protein